MAVTAGMIWLFAYVRYRPDRGFDSLCFLPGLVLKYFCLSGKGWGVLPIMAYTGRYMKRQLGSYSLTEVYERVGKSVIWVCERAQRANRSFYGFIKSRKRSIFVIDSYLNDSVFTAVKRDAKFKTRYVKGVPFVNRRCTKGVPLS